MLGMLLIEPAVLKTAMTSPDVLFRILAFAGGVPILWGLVQGFHHFVKRWIRRLDWRPRRMTPVFLGIGTVGLLSIPQEPTLTARLALVTPLVSEETPRSFSRQQLDPATLAVLQPPQRRSQGGPAPLTKPRPHVVLIVLESIRWQADSLFNRGFPQAVHFDRVYAHYPRSIKTLEALLFGIYPSPTQVTAAWSIDKYAVERMSPLPWLLRERGYETTYYAAMDPSYDNYGTVMKLAGVDQVELVSGGQQLTWGEGDAATVLTRVKERLERGVLHQKPQFIMAWTAECHMPYDYAGGQQSTSPREQYVACHHSLAQSVETFVRQLERAGRLDDTLVVVLGDHGEIFPEEKLGEWGHGFQVYEPSVRIPVLMFIPGVPGGAHDLRLFQPVDISSTLLERLGLPVPQGWVGRDMLDRAEPGRDFVVVVNFLANGAIGIVENTGEKYVRRASGGMFLSYDLNADPTEQVELRVSQAATEAVTRKIETYLSFVTQQWESLRTHEAVSIQMWPGKMLNQWARGTCVMISPDDETGVASVQPVRSPKCEKVEGPEERVFFRLFPRAPFKEGVRIQLELRIDAVAELQGRPLRAWAKASIAEPLMSTTVQPLVGEWQTISLTLPRISFTIDPEGTERAADILIMIAPLDVPARYTLRTVTVEPIRHSLPEFLWAWWVRRFS
jgi:arylsulfatase A-like enzyme